MFLKLLILLTAACMVTGDNLNPNVVNVANFAIDFHNRMNNNYTYAFKVLNILSDTAQLYPPAWVKYTLKVETAETVCKNQDNDVNLTECPLKTNAVTMICSFVVFAVPGNNTIPKRLLSDHCVRMDQKTY
ncbi:uncharacterized protein [Paramisgurnus dabryanus]|uniref:uncharacterized protein n=1 Tax=Paramisgurnus dabryanus TaxID=90735 RepID=UPI0031F46E04